MGPEPPPERNPAAAPALPDRPGLLSGLSEHLATAWASFDRPRPAEPEIDERLIEQLAQALPEEAGDAQAALADAVHVLDASVSPSRPLYLAYVGSSGLEVSVLGAALAAAYDANLATAAGAADLLDRQALRWVAELIGYPLAEGSFTSGGQTSNLTALLAAREHALPGTREWGVVHHRAAVYCSDEAHHSVVRAVEIAGLGRRALRRIPIDGRRRMRTDALEQTLALDREHGVTPIAVIATAGTTLTGAVDPIGEIAAVCEREDVWLHVDGAYGAPAAATATARRWFEGLERADSVTIDAHKWLGVPKSCSLVLVRRRGALRAAFGHEERYMLHEEDTANPVDQTLEYSRPFRSLRLWLALRVHGAAAFRAWIERTLDHAVRLAAAVRAHERFELLHEPMLSTVCFRHVPAGVAADQLDEHNERLALAMQRDGRIFIAAAEVDGRTCLRACFVNYRTAPEAVALVLVVAGELGDALARSGG